MRLQRYLAQSGVASRRRAEELITKGDVRVNGETVAQLGYQVDTEKDRVEVQGRRVRPSAPLYRLLLKPRACLSTLGETKRGETVRPNLSRYVPDRDIGWLVVAPLDFPAEGVVLLTTDGELAQEIGRGGGKVPMTYHLKYQGAVGDEDIGKLLRGWRWNRRPVRPESVVALATTGKNTWVEIVVKETRPRVLKASGEALRKTVLKISRTKLGPLSFEGLSLGQSRDLSRAEVNALRRAAGLL
jgi:23S rRNA pseudouridine2605 synthase